VALVLAPFVARGLGITLIQPTSGPSSRPSDAEPANRESLPDIQPVMPPSDDEIIAIRSEGEDVWYALTHPLSIDIARLVAQYGYTIQGVEYDLATGKPTGRTIPVAPSIRKRWGVE